MGLFDENDDEPMAPVNKQPTPVAQINAGMAPPARSKWDTLKSALGTGVERVSSAIMPEPKGLDGLLSPEDYASARRQGLLDLGLSLLGDQSPTFGPALARGVGAAREGYEGRLSGSLQSQQYGQAARQQKSLLESRAAIAKQFVAPPNETFEQAEQRLVKMFAAYSQSGDTEMMGKLSEVVKGIHANKPRAPVSVAEGGSLVDPADGKVIYKSPKTAALAAPGAEAAQSRSDRIQQNLIVSDFEKATKDYGKIEEAYNAVQASVKNPNNPYGTMAALEGMARMLNPGVSVRAATLQMLKGYGSIGEKIARFYESGAKGTWPAGMRQEIYDIANSAMEGSSANFDERRAEAIHRAQMQGVDVEGLLHNRRQSGAKADDSKKGSASRVRRALGSN